MRFDTITEKDLPEIQHLQPEGWPDIVREFEYYIKKKFCHPIKVLVKGKVVGIGCGIVFGKTGWLAHIIVDKNQRKQGIGQSIVKELLDINMSLSVRSNMLIATELGKPVYEKAGFRTISEYLYLKRDKPLSETNLSKNITSYEKKYYSELIGFDETISGEKREPLISDYVDFARIFVNDGKIEGYFIPNLGEGIIIAQSELAGIELMKAKYSKVNMAVLPGENITGTKFLHESGFNILTTKGSRMILGEDIDWKPKNIYSRIGGNFG